MVGRVKRKIHGGERYSWLSQVLRVDKEIGKNWQEIEGERL
jgi:hypothetical protein